MRMGRDKALVEFQGEMMIQRIVRQLKEHFDEIIVTTGEAKRYQELLSGVTILEDEIKNCGPLGGLYTGLKSVSNEYCFVTACDMPFLTREFIKFLNSQIDEKYDAVIPEVGDIMCVTRAIYSKRCISITQNSLRKSQFSLQALVQPLAKKIVSEKEMHQIDSNLSSLRTFNTQEELASFYAA